MDPFVIYGDLYKSLREAVNGAMYGNQVDALKEIIQVLLLSNLIISWQYYHCTVYADSETL